VILAVLQPVPAGGNGWVDHLELFHVRVEVGERQVWYPRNLGWI
jgi:hypothetical protein